jgi:hypothetical protein
VAKTFIKSVSELISQQLPYHENRVCDHDDSLAACIHSRIVHLFAKVSPHLPYNCDEFRKEKVMDSLYQRLKELDADTFQRLCFQLLKERHPEQDIRHVEGASGDKGLDVFAGELYGKPAIWQCKAFPNGVGDSQKGQIRESLRTALKHSSPAHWILCLSVDLDEKTSRWFEKLKKSNEGTVKIGKMFASDIVNELLHRRTLQNHFFPNASLDVMELKRLAARTGQMTSQELDALTDINLEDTIEHWKDRDARFNYQIVFDGDLGPLDQSSVSVPSRFVMSIRKPGSKTVNVFERDVESLRADPPKFTTTFKGSGIEKFEKLFKTGVPQEFDTHELGPITSKWPLMSDVTNAGNTYKLTLGPSPVVMNRKRSVRVEFIGQGGSQTVRYELLDLKPVRLGTEEFEISLSGKNIPFKLFIAMSNPPKGDAAFNIENDWVQREPKEIQKSLDAFNLLRPSGQIRIFDLETEKNLVEAGVQLPEETPLQVRRRNLIADAVSIATRFGITLRLPENIEEEDFETIHFIKQFVENGTVEFATLSIVITKSPEIHKALLECVSNGKGFFTFEHTQENPPRLFGTPIDMGRVVIETEAEISNPGATLRRFAKAKIGAGVRIVLKPLGPVRVSLSSANVDKTSTEVPPET